MKVLVLVDLQNDFIDGSLGTKEAEAIIEPLIKKIKSFHGFIIMTKDTHDKNYLSTQEGKNLPVEHCIKGTYGWEINEKIMNAVKKSKNEVILLEKETFGSNLLVDIIKKKVDNIDQIEFDGLCTDICVVSNVLIAKAGFIEVPIIVDAECCAGVTKESHEAALKTMSMCQVNIMNGAN